METAKVVGNKRFSETANSTSTNLSNAQTLDNEFNDSDANNVSNISENELYDPVQGATHHCNDFSELDDKALVFESSQELSDGDMFADTRESDAKVETTMPELSVVFVASEQPLKSILRKSIAVASETVATVVASPSRQSRRRTIQIVTPPIAERRAKAKSTPHTNEALKTPIKSEPVQSAPVDHVNLPATTDDTAGIPLKEKFDTTFEKVSCGFTYLTIFSLDYFS